MIAEPSTSRRTFAADADWPRERAERLDLRPEADREALERLDREGTGDVRSLGEASRADEAQRADRAHELRPVDEREPLLRLQPDRLEPRASQRLRARERVAVEERPPLADQRKRQVRERREVAGGADGAAARHVRENASVQTLEQQLDRLDPGARVALRKRVGAKHHRRADDLVGVRLPHAARMASKQPELELLGELGRDRAGRRSGRSPC